MKYVVGHQNPDTDSYCAAVVYAQYLCDIGEEAKAIVLGEANLETRFVFTTFGLSLPEIVTHLPAGSEIVLVDHNEASQSIIGREELIIDTVIDHHKIADFTTSYPVQIRCEKVGCTCTILAEIFTEQGYVPSPPFAGLMVSAIVSDTLYFRSPTTTTRDREIVEKMASLAGIDNLEQYAMEMFTAKSDLGDISAEKLVMMDYKTFDFHGYSMGISVLETTNPGYALGRKQEILDTIVSIKQKDGLAYMLFCVVDILEEKNIAFVVGEQEKQLVEAVFDASTHDALAALGGRVSRKKQIVPPLDTYFAAL